MKKHGVLWWLFIGWWWWVYALPFRLLLALFKRSKTPTEPPKPMAFSQKVEPHKPTEFSQKVETHRVAGTSFHQDAIKAMGMKNPDFEMTKRGFQYEGLIDKRVYEYDFVNRDVELQPEPDNPHDPKAIKVVVDGRHVGYIKAGSCAHIHKLLAAGRLMRVTGFIGGGKSKTLYWDDNLNQYELSEDEIPFYVHLTVVIAPEN